MLFGSECVEACPENTLNLMNSECISKESCEQENSEFWKDFKFVSSNGSCRLIKYCDSIKINVDEEVIETEISLKRRTFGCQVVRGFVDIQFPNKSGCKDASINAAFKALREIEEIYDYLKVTNSPTLRNLEFLPKLKMIRGVNLESGLNSFVIDSNTALGPLSVTSKNYTFNCETFCVSNLNNSNMALKITPKTYGFVVEILNKELYSNISYKSMLMESIAYHREEICGSLSLSPP